MAITNAEKQKRYRIRHYGLDPDKGYAEGFDPLHRLQTNISSLPAANLRRLVQKTGKSKRQIIEEAINEYAERLGCNYDD